MTKFMVALIFLIASSSAYAKDVTLTLNDQEQKVFFALLDSALKNGGLQNLQSVTQFIQKFQGAAANVPPPLPAPPSTSTAPEKK